MKRHAKKTAAQDAENTYYNRYSDAPATDAAGVVKGYSPLPPFFVPAAAIFAAIFAALAIFE